GAGADVAAPGAIQPAGPGRSGVPARGPGTPLSSQGRFPRQKRPSTVEPIDASCEGSRSRTTRAARPAPRRTTRGGGGYHSVAPSSGQVGAGSDRLPISAPYPRGRPPAGSPRPPGGG